MLAHGAEAAFRAGDPIFHVVSGVAAMFVHYTPDSREYVAIVRCRQDGSQIHVRPGELAGYRLQGTSPKIAARLRTLKSLYPLPTYKRWLRKSDILQIGDEWLSNPEIGLWAPIPAEFVGCELECTFMEYIPRGDEERMAIQVDAPTSSTAFNWDAAIDSVASGWASEVIVAPKKRRRAKPRRKATPERAPGGRKFDAGM